MTKEAIEILVAAASGDGHVLYTRALGGDSISAGRRKLVAQSEVGHRVLQFWIGALEDLEELRYIRRTGGDTGYSLFEVTREGYSKSDELQEKESE